MMKYILIEKVLFSLRNNRFNVRKIGVFISKGLNATDRLVLGIWGMVVSFIGIMSGRLLRSPLAPVVLKVESAFSRFTPYYRRLTARAQKTLRMVALLSVSFLTIAFLVGLVSRTAMAAIPVAAWWKFDEGTGTSASDSSGNGNTASWSGVSTWTTGKYLNAVSFNGTSESNLIAYNDQSIQPTAGVTVEAWFKPSANFTFTAGSASPDYNQGIVDKGDYRLYLDHSDGKAHFVVNDGSAKTWTSVGGTSMDNTVQALGTYNGDLYVGGSFTLAPDGTTVNRIARYNGTSWSSVGGTSMNSSAGALAVYNGNLYAGGGFTQAPDGTSVNYLAKYNGTSWSSVGGTSTSSSVTALGVYNGNLYAGGNFTRAPDGTAAYWIAQYNGTSWSSVGGTSMNSTVNALGVYNGNLYVGGGFTQAPDGTAAYRIAQYNGTSWSSVGGTSMNNVVNAIAVYNGNLHVAGAFTQQAPGGTEGNRIAQYNGTSWSSVGGTSMNNVVNVLGVYNGNLYAGGSFTRAPDGTAVNRIARYNGTSWSSVGGTSMENTVFALGVYNGNLYAGGAFTQAPDGTAISKIVKYGTANVTDVASTTSSWTSGTWYHLAGVYDGSDLKMYVDGTAQTTTATSMTSIAAQAFPLLIGKTYGSQSAGGSGELAKGIIDDVRIYTSGIGGDQITTDKNDTTVYAPDPVAWWKLDEGTGTTANDSTVNGNSGTLSGTTKPTWQTEELCLSGKCLYFDGSTAYVTQGTAGLTVDPVGYWKFDEGTGTSASDSSGNSNTANWTGSNTWTTGKYSSAVSFGGTNENYLSAANSASLQPTTGITVEGWFKPSANFTFTAGSASPDYNQGIIDKGDYRLYLDKSDGKAHFVVADNAAKSWSSTGGTSMDTYVVALGIYSGDLYAGGTFTQAPDGTSVNYLAKYNGTSWSSVGGTSMNNEVDSLTVYNGNLYAGGNFTRAPDGTVTGRIAKYNGTSWSGVGGTSTETYVTELVAYNGNLYAGGYFTRAPDGTAARYVAQYNGTSWSNVGGTSMNDLVHALTVYNGNLYVGGQFTRAPDGTAAYRIAQYNGTSWSAVGGTSLDNMVQALGTYNSNLYAGGQFTRAPDGTAAYRIAQYNGTSWSAVGGTSMGTTVYSLISHNGNLYAGGAFNNAPDGTAANFLAKYNGTSWSAVGGTSMNDWVFALASFNGNLYAGGVFTRAPDGTATYRIAKYSSGNVTDVASTTTSWTADTWYHLAGVYDGSNLKMYVDGSSQNSTATSMTAIAANTVPLLIGKSYGAQTGGGSGELAAGAVDDLRIYSDARSPTEVTNDMNNVSGGSGSRLLVTGAMTLSAWVKLSTNNSVHDVIAKRGASGNYGYRLYTDANGKANMEVASSTDGSTLTTATGSTTLSTNTWYFITGTYTPSGSVLIYVNGIQDGASAGNGPAAVKNSTAALEIGSENGGGTNLMAGFIDDVKVFDKVLTAEQIKVNYNVGSARQSAVKGAGTVMGGVNPDINGPGSSSLVGYWRMDEGSWTNNCAAGTVTDYSGSGNSGKSCPDTTGPLGAATGKFGNGGLFDGSNDYLDMGDASSLKITQEITVSAWVYITSNGTGSAPVVGKWSDTSGQRSYLLTIGYGGNYRPRFLISNNSAYNNKYDGYSTTTVPTSTWTHLVGVYDGSNIQIYMNGEPLPMTFFGTAPNDPGSIYDSTASVTVGRYDSTLKFPGSMDEVRIYKRALTPVEISQLYNWAPGPVGYWRFEEGTGTTANDSSSRANTASWTGTSAWSSGKYGKGVSFTGTGENYLSAASSSTLAVTSPLTVEAWFKPSASFTFTAGSVSPDYSQGIIDKGDYRLYLDKSDGKAHFVVNDSAAKSWSNTGGTSLDNTVYALGVYNGNLYAGGAFALAPDGTSVRYLAQYNGTSWSSVGGTSMANQVRALSAYNGNLYAGGSFSTAPDGTSVNYLAQYNGTSWSSVGGTSINYIVYALGVYNGNLYAGGEFTRAPDGVITGRIAKYNGTSWSSVGGTSVDNTVYALGVYNGNLYAGGAFTRAPDGTSVNYLAQYNGTSWSSVGGTGMDMYVYALGVYNGNLYAGGIFFQAPDGTTVNYLAKYNGTSWSSVGGTSMDLTVYSLGVYNGDLYAGGDFTQAPDGTAAYRIAKYNGTSWSSVGGTSVDNTVYALGVYNGNLYAGGGFTQAPDGAAAYRIAKYSSGNTVEVTSASTSWTADTWYHLAGVYDGSNLKMYVNGALQTSSSTSMTSLAAQAFPLLIGKTFGSQMAGGSGELLNGVLDEFRVYNYARNPKQITEDLNVGHPAGGSPVGSAVGYWKFDEGADNTCSGGVNDACNSGSQGANLDGTSTATRTNSGKFGAALDFDGTDDVVTVTDSSSVDLYQQTGYTVCGWILPDNAGEGSAGEWFSKGTSYVRVDTLSGSTVEVSALINLASSNATRNTTRTIPTTGYSHVCVTWEDDSDDELSIYINGTLDGTSSDGSGSAADDTASQVLIGGDSSNNFNGRIDEFKIYSFALTAEEVKAEYNHGSTIVLGSFSDTSLLTGGSVASNSASARYCVPGDSSTCEAPRAEVNFEEGSGSLANDTSGNGHNGTWNGTGRHWAGKGKVGNGGIFDGTSDFTACNTSCQGTDNLDMGTSSWTAEAWIKTSAADEAVVGKTDFIGGSNPDGWFLGISTTGRVSTWIRKNGVGQVSSTDDGTVVNDGNWHHVAVVFNRSGNMVRYVDGQPTGTQDSITSLSAQSISNANQFEIGARDASGDPFYFSGNIDQVKVYSYARSQAQIDWDYNRGAPTGWWKMDECQGGTVHDSTINANGTANGHDGTITIGTNGPQNAIGACGDSGSSATAHAWYNGYTGKFNHSLSLDGNDDYITTAAFADMAGVGQTLPNVSWGGWFYATASANLTSKTLIEKATEYQLLTNASQQPQCGIYLPGGFLNATAGSTALSTNAWNHVLCVHDSSNFYTYLNGVLSGTTTDNHSIISTSSVLYLGETSGGANRFFGQIDDVKIWNYPLTGVQVRSEYNQGSAVRFGPASGSP